MGVARLGRQLVEYHGGGGVIFYRNNSPPRTKLTTKAKFTGCEDTLYVIVKCVCRFMC